MAETGFLKIIEIVIIAIIFISSLSFVISFAITIIGRFFENEIDPMISQVLDLLPNTDCGVCGYPSCLKYSDAVINKNEALDLCHPGAELVENEIKKALGKDKPSKVKQVAKIFCLGDNETSRKHFDFNGDDYCQSVFKFFGGDKVCKYGCLGMGDCMRICPVNAIKRDEYRRVWIDASECNGCKKCIDICPTKVIKMVPVKGGYFVACSNHDDGETVSGFCKKGCTACGICEKTAGAGRIHVENNLAKVVFDSSIDLHDASIKCPVDVIVPILNQIVHMSDNKNNKQDKDNNI